MTIEVGPWDASEHLDSPEMISAYLEVALEDGDPAQFSRALGHVARAIGMTQIARETGLSREALYRALSGAGNPEFGTVLKVMNAFGLRLTPVPLSA